MFYYTIMSNESNNHKTKNPIYYTKKKRSVYYHTNLKASNTINVLKVKKENGVQLN